MNDGYFFAQTYFLCVFVNSNCTRRKKRQAGENEGGNKINFQDFNLFPTPIPDIFPSARQARRREVCPNSRLLQAYLLRCPFQ